MKKLRYMALAFILVLLCAAPFQVKQVQAATPYSQHGALSVKGRDLVDKRGKKFQLKGVSTHGLAWFPQYVNKKTFQFLRDNWGVNAVRLAMYTEEYGGYCSGGNQKELEAKIQTGVKACSQLGMYCIIDWHILSDGNPNKNVKEAKKFFTRMASRYRKSRYVIYEICNEPNGGTSWAEIKRYAEQVIPVIRRYSPNAIILVGTPNWSQDVDVVAQDPIRNQKNIMYTLHFYAATHQRWLRNKLTKARRANLPIFISEFSFVDASGNGAVDKSSATQWRKLIKNYNLSYCAWSLCNKNESSALLKPSVSKTSDWKYSDLSEMGRYIYNMIKKS